MHTQGPWSYEQIGVTDAGPNPDDVFDIGPCDREGTMRKRIATVVGDDARLIAAAPDLLAALQAIADMKVDHTTNHADLGALMRAVAQTAIAKATT